MTDSIPYPGGPWPVLQPGWVWLCGAGPGDPGLVTLHALNALRQADVVVHDALVNPSILDWAPQAELVHAGKRGGKPSARQSDITLHLIDLARAGRRVLRLKGGDPFVFGRGGEEMQMLVAQGVPVRIIPGISAGIGGLGCAGIPATHRDVNQAVTFVTGHDQSGNAPASLNWQAISDGAPVIVIFMGMKHVATITAALLAAGRPADQPCAVVSSATMAEQRVLPTTLGAMAADIAAAGMEPPSILCIGRSVLVEQALDWQGMITGLAPGQVAPVRR